MKMSIGVDLHKSQFTVCFLAEDRKAVETGLYPTKEIGYEEFLSKYDEYQAKGYEVRAAVESTGNARYFRNRLISAGIDVAVVNEYVGTYRKEQYFTQIAGANTHQRRCRNLFRAMAGDRVFHELETQETIHGVKVSLHCSRRKLSTGGIMQLVKKHDRRSLNISRCFIIGNEHRNDWDMCVLWST